MPVEPLETERLIIRPWEDRDKNVFHRLYSDEQVMRYFPYRKTYEEAELIMQTINGFFEKVGFSFGAMESRRTGDCIGMAGLHRINMPEIFSNSGVEIGWRLLPEFWHMGYVTEAGVRLLDYGFNTLQVKEIMSFAVQDNLPSIAVMQRIGMKARPELNFDHPEVPDDHPDLKPHVVYALSSEDW